MKKNYFNGSYQLIITIIIVLHQFQTSHLAPLLENLINVEINLETNSNIQLEQKVIRINSTSHQLLQINKINQSLIVVGIHTKYRNVSLCQSNNVQSITMSGTNFGIAIQNHLFHDQTIDIFHQQPPTESICLYNKNSNPINVLLVENRYADNTGWFALKIAPLTHNIYNFFPII